MDERMRFFATTWRGLWGRSAGDAACAEARLSDPARLDDTPAYPLARTVGMPEGHAYKTGAVSFRLQRLSLGGMSRLGAEGCAEEGAGGARVRLKFTLERLVLRGRYSLEVKPDPVISLDTGGNLLDLPPEALRPSAAGAEADSDAPLDPQKEEWLDQARDQRTRLSQTDNGQKLLGLYNQHNETYDEVFKSSPALPELWRAGGATRSMAADTSDALKTDGVVNSAGKTYDSDTGPVSYNSNAFSQQLNVAAACMWADADFDPATGPPKGSKYVAAGKAALSFGKGVKTTTNNDKENVNEMKPSEVHATVERHEGDLPPTSDREVTRLAGEIGSGGAEADGDLGWTVVGEEDRRRLQYLYQTTMKHRAESANVSGRPLFRGRCRARVEGVEAVVELAVEDEGGGRRARLVSAQIQMPAFELDVDDSRWGGEVGRVARRRLERMYFIRSLLHDSITERLRGDLGRAAEMTYNRLLDAA